MNTLNSERNGSTQGQLPRRTEQGGKITVHSWLSSAWTDKDLPYQAKLTQIASDSSHVLILSTGLTQLKSRHSRSYYNLSLWTRFIKRTKFTSKSGGFHRHKIRHCTSPPHKESLRTLDRWGWATLTTWLLAE